LTRTTRRLRLALPAAISTCLLTVAGAASAHAAPAAPPGTTPRPACGTVSRGHATCFALIRAATKTPATRAAGDAPPAGYGPADLASAYNLASAQASGAGVGQTVAIVDAFDDPTAAADLAIYRASFGLAPCTTHNGCFREVNQYGGKRPPPVDDGWAAEISLDLQAVSAACPACNILLVEAHNNSVSALANAEDTAARLGADAISNSYGAAEYAGMRRYEPDYTHAGVAITVATGDSGYGPAQFPANLTSVTAVGGTSLVRDDFNTRGWDEFTWSGSGSGCSAWIPKPAWQHDKRCPGRMTADVSAVANPYTGLAVYDTTPNPYGLPTGWLIIGGTSASTPLIAGIYALAGNADQVSDASGLYADRNELNDIVGGSNGSCANTYLCTAKVGYDGPTGLGTPNGTGAF
jgi:subtilase family serine protease